MPSALCTLCALCALCCCALSALCCCALSTLCVLLNIHDNLGTHLHFAEKKAESKMVTGSRPCGP